MAKGHKPVAGSRAYWPKKRTKNIYSRAKTFPCVKEAVPLDFAGYKAGMTRVKYIDSKKGSVTEGQEIVKPVTVVDVPSLFVCGIKTYSKRDVLESSDVVWTERLSKDLKRKTRTPENTDTKNKLSLVEKTIDKIVDVRILVHTKPRESGIGKKKPELFELSLGGDVKGKWKYARQKIGTEIKASDVFKEGEWVDVKAVTKGKGFQGPVKRFGIKVRSRKNQKKRRHVGNMGPRTPARVLPGKIAQAGQLGYQMRTELNKRVMKIGTSGVEVTPEGGFLNYGIVKGSYILLDGSVPGPKKRLIMIRKAVRAHEPPHAYQDIKTIRDSQQGV